MTPLELDASCCNRTNWRADLPPETDAELIEMLLVEKGYQSRCRHPALKVFRHPRGHEVAWVTTSGRLQIRVDVGVAQADRKSCAESLYQDLAACLERSASRHAVEALG